MYSYIVYYIIIIYTLPFIYTIYKYQHIFTGGSDGKESACNAGYPGLIPVSGRFPGGGHSNPLQYSCLENPMDRRAWWATVHGVAKSQTQLSKKHNILHILLYIHYINNIKSIIQILQYYHIIKQPPKFNIHRPWEYAV